MAMKTRDEIIDRIVATFCAEAKQDASQSLAVLHYEAIVRDTLAGKLRSLRTNEMVRTCDDFDQLGIECCKSCHSEYPHYEIGRAHV